MFLTRIAENSNINYDVSVIHLAESMRYTLCRRYTPINQIKDMELYYQLCGMTLKEYMNMIINNPKQENNICKHCLKKYKKEI